LPGCWRATVKIVSSHYKFKSIDIKPRSAFYVPLSLSNQKPEVSVLESKIITILHTKNINSNAHLQENGKQPPNTGKRND